MITEAYDNDRESLLTPGAFLGEQKHVCDSAIATFSGDGRAFC